MTLKILLPLDGTACRWSRRALRSACAKAA
jgi:hypothetical protein